MRGGRQIWNLLITYYLLVISYNLVKHFFKYLEILLTLTPRKLV